MHRSRDRDGLERETIAAHSLYIASFTEMERLHYALRFAAPGVTAFDLRVAESEHGRRFAALRDLVDALGYVPRGVTARLPPDPGARGRDRARAGREARRA